MFAPMVSPNMLDALHQAQELDLLSEAKGSRLLSTAKNARALKPAGADKLWLRARFLLGFQCSPSTTVEGPAPLAVRIT